MILDNCAIHHVEGIVELFQEYGVWYTSYHCIHQTMIPFKKLFLKLNVLLRVWRALHYEILDLQACMAAALGDISSDNCQAWLSHCGIYITL